MTVFKEVDDIVKLGKWAYVQIPSGTRCKDCPLLCKEGPDGLNRVFYGCGLRPGMALCHDEDGPIKYEYCPVEKKEVS